MQAYENKGMNLTQKHRNLIKYRTKCRGNEAIRKFVTKMEEKQRKKIEESKKNM